MSEIMILTSLLVSTSFLLAMLSKGGDGVLVLLRLLGILMLFFAACEGNIIILVVTAVFAILINQLNAIGVATAVTICIIFIY